MPIRVRKRPIKININGQKKNGYCHKAVIKGKKSLKDVIEASLNNSKLNWDCHEALIIFEMTVNGIIEYLKDGYAVDLGSLGRFKPTVNGKMEENQDDLNLNDVEIGINYKISDTLKKAIAEAQIEIEEKDYDIRTVK